MIGVVGHYHLFTDNWPGFQTKKNRQGYSKVRCKCLKERGEKDRSRIVLVVVIVLAIAFLWACFEDEDENENEISQKVPVRTKDISHQSNHLCECTEYP